MTRENWPLIGALCACTALITFVSTERLIPKPSRYELQRLDPMPAVVRMDKKTGAADISIAGQAWKPITEAGPDAYAAFATSAP